jgi:hypothetical protein
MAGYQYRCSTHGLVEARFPIGTAPSSLDCKSCRAPAARVFSSPALTTQNAAGAKALQMHEKSQTSPGVVVRSTDNPVHRPGRGTDRPPTRLPRP